VQVYRGLPDELLVRQCIRLDQDGKEIKKELDAVKVEVQSRGINLMDDRNIKYVKLYCDLGTTSVTESQQMDVLNMDRLKELFGEGLIKEKVTETTDIKYKFDSKFEKALKAIFTGDYTFEYTLDEFLDEMSVKPDGKQKRLLLKKLKGDYKQDRLTLLTVLDYMKRGDDEREVEAPDFDVELYYIYKIKNGELIRAFMKEEDFLHMMEEVKKCIFVESKTTIAIDYKTEE
jgi:hypothetical protein